MRSSFVSEFILVVLVMLLSGCDPGVLNYRPVSSEEKQAFDHAQLNVYPNDVRKDIARYNHTTVAWPGVVISSKLTERPNGVEIQLLLEHHYYTWEEIVFITWIESIFLSPRGEGNFTTSWLVPKDKDVEAVKKSFMAGNLVFVYGIPEQVNADKTITVKAIQLRTVDRRKYAFEKEYGRGFHFSPHNSQ